MSLPVSRRLFMGAAGAAAFGSVLAVPDPSGNKGRAAAGQFTGRIKKAVKFQMVREKLSVVDKFKLLKDLGFDVGNVVRFGWPEQWIRILKHRIGKLDVKEYSRKKQMNEGLRKGFDVELGEGDCGWPAVRKALAEIDYRGWATAEVPGGDRKRLAHIAARMDRVLELSP